MLNSKNIHFALLGIILGSAIAYIYGSYLLEAGRRIEAETVAGAVAGQAPTHPEVTEQDMAALFSQALEANPNDPELLSRYGDFLFGRGRYPEAAELFERALAIQPEDAATRTAMAAAIYGAGRVDEAIQQFQRAIESDPGYAQAFNYLALAYLGAGNDVAAEDTIGRLEALNPVDPQLPSLRARLEEARDN